MRIASLLLAVVSISLFSGCGESPGKIYESIVVQADKGNWGAVYDRMDEKSRRALEKNVRQLGLAKTVNGRQVPMSGKDFFIKNCEAFPSRAKERFAGRRVIRQSGSGYNITLTVEIIETGEEDEVEMVFDGNRWMLVPPKD